MRRDTKFTKIVKEMMKVEANFPSVSKDIKNFFVFVFFLKFFSSG